MQYHVNGFKPGDPDILPAAPGHRRAGDPLPARVDVLIAGAGPAGLCLAAQLARVASIRTVLVEPKAGPMEKGQADGISVRTMEMFQAFGFAEKVMRESVWINETTLAFGSDFDMSASFGFHLGKMCSGRERTPAQASRLFHSFDVENKLAVLLHRAQ